ncbi:hypothetical protein HXT53_00910 [Gardnerella sp. KA00390]|uniref:hypothetical protein n=1 Tax=Gardnerella TaxID=2701 RepID=UPI001573D736|nr:hypothetical protein [Gardnerella vaginalis]MDK7212656.1 hypothetical protein [Gardnerella vaginalis]MDK8338410.1 hypothetical protein [Gardnerella vaginalis]NSX27325.1 hypothetical protein [Gardnerella vaginalis]
MLNKKAIAGIAAASIVVSCGFVGSFAFADEVPANNPVTTPAGYPDEVPNNPPKPAPVTTPTVKPEDDIYGSGSEWDQLQNTENEYENYYDQMYNTHKNYNGNDKPLPKFDPHMFDEDHDPNGNDTKPEIPVNPDEHKTDPQTPPAPEPKVDTTKEDAEFKAAQDLANQKAQNALLLKQMAEGSVKALQAKIDKATGAEKTKLQEQLENAQKIASSFSELNDKATSVAKAYTQAATIRSEVKALEGQVATAQAKFDALAKQQTGPSGSEAYNKAAEELGKLQKQLKNKKNLLTAANKGVTKAEETLVKQETKVQEVQNPKKEEPKTPTISEILSTIDGDKVADYKLTPADVSKLVGEKKNTDPVTPTPKPVKPVNPKPVTPVNPKPVTPSVTPSVTPTPSTPSDDTPSSDDDTAPSSSSTPSVTTPSASTTAGASQSAPSAAPAAGVPAAPASVADLLPGLKGMLTVGANNVAVAGAVNKVTLNISNQAFLDSLNRDGSAKAYAFIYSSPRLLKGADGANYVTVRMVNGKPQFDAMFPAGYSGKHTVVLVDEQGNQLGWTDITVKNGTATQGEGLPNSGVGIALIALTASVLAGAGATFRKIRR